VPLRLLLLLLLLLLQHLRRSLSPQPPLQSELQQPSVLLQPRALPLQLLQQSVR
jgi:hypothetical protein